MTDGIAVPGAGWRRAGGSDVTQQPRKRRRKGGGGWGGGGREVAMVDGGGVHLVLRPADRQAADVEDPRRAAVPVPRRARPARRRSSGRWPSSPAAGAGARPRTSPPAGGALASVVLLIVRPGPAGAVPAHAAGVQADVAAVGGLLHPVAVQRADRGHRGLHALPRSRQLLALSCPRLKRSAQGRRGGGGGVRRADGDLHGGAAGQHRRRRRGTSRTTSCRSCSPARRWPPAAGSRMALHAGRRGRAVAARWRSTGAAIELAAMHKVENGHGIVSEPYHDRPGRARCCGRRRRAPSSGAGLTVRGRAHPARGGCVRNATGGRLAADPVRRLRRRHGQRQGPEVHRHPAARAPGGPRAEGPLGHPLRPAPSPVGVSSTRMARVGRSGEDAARVRVIPQNRRIRCTPYRGRPRKRYRAESPCCDGKPHLHSPQSRCSRNGGHAERACRYCARARSVLPWCNSSRWSPGGGSSPSETDEFGSFLPTCHISPTGPPRRAR